MLTLEQIIDLQSKGFTYDQLQVLNSMDTSTPEPEKQEPEKKDPEKQEPEKKDPEKQEPEKKEPENEHIKALHEEIEKLTETVKAMQSVNIKNAQSEPPKTETVDDIIKSFMVAS